MRHAGTQEIETPRLILRRLLPEDANRMYVNWANDPDVTRFLRWEPHKNVAETRQLLEAWATLYPNEDYYQWAIVEKATGQVFGSISIYNSLLGEPQQKAAWPGLDFSEGIWEPGYCIGKAWWNKGFTTEALRAVVEYWFKTTDSNWLACCPAAAQHDAGLRRLALLGHLGHGFHMVGFAQGRKFGQAPLTVPQALIQCQQDDFRRGCFH